MFSVSPGVATTRLPKLTHDQFFCFQGGLRRTRCHQLRHHHQVFLLHGIRKVSRHLLQLGACGSEEVVQYIQWFYAIGFRSQRGRTL